MANDSVAAAIASILDSMHLSECPDCPHTNDQHVHDGCDGCPCAEVPDA